jgi:hypothetical protein
MQEAVNTRTLKEVEISELVEAYDAIKISLAQILSRSPKDFKRLSRAMLEMETVCNEYSKFVSKLVSPYTVISQATINGWLRYVSCRCPVPPCLLR